MLGAVATEENRVECFDAPDGFEAGERTVPFSIAGSEGTITESSVPFAEPSSPPGRSDPTTPWVSRTT